MVPAEDARFLHDLIVEVRPQVVVECGVASGCSSVAILDAMAKCRDDRLADGVWLHAFDIAETCYFNRAYTTGAAVAELTPQHLPRFRLTVGDALCAGRRLAGLDAPFAFIDANHLHPWATADLLALLPALAPGAWVALHDIRLPLLGRHDFRGHGPRYLFDSWTGEKRQGGTDRNIGAVRLPDDLREVPTRLAPVLQRCWEVELPGEVCEALQIVPRPVHVVPRRQALRELVRAAGRERPLYVCGTGQAGRTLAGELRRRGLAVAGFADGDPLKDGAVIDGVPVRARRLLSHREVPRPFMAVSGTYAKEIDAELTLLGWLRGEDYVVM
jgi:predicted O-methyltransferase YrrM